MKLSFKKAIEELLIPRYAGLWLTRWEVYERTIYVPDTYTVYAFYIVFDAIQQIYKKSDEQIIAALELQYSRDGLNMFDRSDIGYVLNLVRGEDNEN